MGVYRGGRHDPGVCGGVLFVGFVRLCGACGGVWVGVVGACGGGAGGVFLGFRMLSFPPALLLVVVWLLEER